MGSLAGHVKRIRASVKAYKARAPQHDEHLYTWRAWMLAMQRVGHGEKSASYMPPAYRRSDPDDTYEAGRMHARGDL